MPVFDDAQLKAMVSERHSVRKYSSGLNEEDKKKLKDAGFLTRDSREVERKKPGQPKATLPGYRSSA